MKNHRVVIDTNVFLVIIPSRSKHHWAFEAVKQNRLDLLLSTEIVLEYEEQPGLRYTFDVTNGLIDVLLLKKNTALITPFYAWNLITADADDNKFVDCAVAGNADMIVTNDKDFDEAKRSPFPVVNVVSIEEFEIIFKKHWKSGKEQ